MSSDGTYLAPKNWDKYQIKLKNGKQNRQWIRLDCNLEDDPAFFHLSDHAQGFLIRCWMYVGRTGRTLPNDAGVLWGMLRYRSGNHSTLGRWLVECLSGGFLIPCFQQNISEFAPQDKTLQDKTGQSINTLAPKRRKQPAPQPIYWQGQILPVTVKSHDALRAAYPDVNSAQQYAKADEWLVNHPANRKSDYPKFLSNWFRKAQADIDRMKLRGANGNGQKRLYGPGTAYPTRWDWEEANERTDESGAGDSSPM